VHLPHKSPEAVCDKDRSFFAPPRPYFRCVIEEKLLFRTARLFFWGLLFASPSPPPPVFIGWLKIASESPPSDYKSHVTFHQGFFFVYSSPPLAAWFTRSRAGLRGRGKAKYAVLFFLYSARNVPIPEESPPLSFPHPPHLPSPPSQDLPPPSPLPLLVTSTLHPP